MLDHKEIGKKLNLFHFQEESVGSVFWHHNGYVIFRVIESYIREFILNRGYIEVKSPQLLNESIWQKSGHLDKYSDGMFLFKDESLGLKPMNCPCHVQIYNNDIVSYKQLPIRMSEFGCCHRNENSGSLNGLFRLRQFVQDDAHIFCSDEQIESEVKKFFEELFIVYDKFGFKKEDLMIKLSLRPENRIGSDEIWDMSENQLRNALDSMQIPYEENLGEGAFYGAKIEIVLKDSLDRHWQCGVVQLDFNLPDRLDASYINSDGKKSRPVMIHRAMLGSIERFIGILLEHHRGKLPLWLSPIQIMICNISDGSKEYAELIYQKLKNRYRVGLNIDNLKINSKISKSYDQNIPYMIIVGDQEKMSNKICLKDMRNNKQIVINLEDVNIENYEY